MKITKAQAKALDIFAAGNVELGLTDGKILMITAAYQVPVTLGTIKALLKKGLIRPLVTCQTRQGLRVVKVRVAA